MNTQNNVSKKSLQNRISIQRKDKGFSGFPAKNPDTCQKMSKSFHQNI